MRDGSASSSREIACDESGYEGENLVGGETDVFAHASVQLAPESAANCIRELRRRIRSPALEYKANHLLREKHRPVLVWLLGTRGPLHGHANVHLVDKTFLVVSKIVEVLVEGHPDAMARSLYRQGRDVFERASWVAFLASANDLMRTRNRQGVRSSADSFYRTVDALRGASVDSDDVLGLFRPARQRIESLRTQLLENPRTVPALDPLVPAIVRTVVHWSGDLPVCLIHDRQTALTSERIAQIKQMFAGSDGRLADLRLVDSRSDPRVQIADFLAGVARKVASDELAGRGDPELVALLRPYVDPSSIWGDERSWSVLEPASTDTDPLPCRPGPG